MAPQRITRSAAAKLQQQAIHPQDSKEEDSGLTGGEMITEVQTPAPKRQTKTARSRKDDGLPSSQKKSEASYGDVQSPSRKGLTIEVPVSSSRTQRSPKAEIRDSDGEGSGETPFKTPSERKRIVFDDDEHEEFVTPMEAPLRNPLETATLALAGEDEEDEEDSDSDDDAPEAISLQRAKDQSAKSSQAASKAAEREADVRRQKRKDRDAFFAEQTRSRRANKATASKSELFGAASEKDAPADAEDAAEVATSESPRKRKPEALGLLPPELLESEDEDEDAPRREQLNVTKSKKIKLDVAERRAKHAVPEVQDARVGSTVYRVMTERENDRLAVKANRASYQLKEKLLGRHRAPEKKGGFLVKRR
ncbi:hypothetical protein GQ53DRAFT_775645 [Thozetella sp. PMI_491]|nr:hypothetical protein GQ53DRAFT_775645 [Thozetella sp. PMI_491]